MPLTIASLRERVYACVARFNESKITEDVYHLDGYWLTIDIDKVAFEDGKHFYIHENKKCAYRNTDGAICHISSRKFITLIEAAFIRNDSAVA
jgi:hypothetical protein